MGRGGRGEVHGRSPGAGVKPLRYPKCDVPIKPREAIEALQAEVQRLKEAIRDLGEHGNVCTYSILKEVCDTCRCGRKQKTEIARG